MQPADYPLPTLNAEARAELARHAHAELVDSTQDWALAQPLPERGCAVFTADGQWAGRGRRGRPWISPPRTTLALSVLRGFDRPWAELAPLGLVAGLAIAQALREAGLAQLRLKWPNDLVIVGDGGDWAKLGGVLVEARPPGRDRDGRRGVALGIGINRDLPDATPIDQHWVDLHRLGLCWSSEQTLTCVLNALLPALARFDQQGFRGFHRHWEALDALAGHEVELHGPEGVLASGTALGIDGDGALRLRQADGELRRQLGGEVRVRVAA